MRADYKLFSLFYDKFQELGKAGTLVVVSAGNSNTNIERNPVYFPSYDNSNLIAVMAVEPDGTRSYYSNYGRWVQGR
jgi:hypothetical protein